MWPTVLRSASDPPGVAFHERECLLAPSDVPPLAAHLVTMRRGYTHHGIYIGKGRVVHYAGLSRGWRFGPVESVALEAFAQRRPIWVRPHSNPRFDQSQIVERARSRLGENCYRILSNNCEHFCEWCFEGEPRSRQVEAIKLTPGHLLLVLRGALASWLLLACRAVWTPNGWAV